MSTELPPHVLIGSFGLCSGRIQLTQVGIDVLVDAAHWEFGPSHLRLGPLCLIEPVMKEEGDVR